MSRVVPFNVPLLGAAFAAGALVGAAPDALVGAAVDAALLAEVAGAAVGLAAGEPPQAARRLTAAKAPTPPMNDRRPRRRASESCCDPTVPPPESRCAMGDDARSAEYRVGCLYTVATRQDGFILRGARRKVNKSPKSRPVRASEDGRVSSWQPHLTTAPHAAHLPKPLPPGGFPRRVGKWQADGKTASLA